MQLVWVPGFRGTMNGAVIHPFWEQILEEILFEL